MKYKVYQGTTLKTTVTSKTATITGLAPLTSYTFGVTPNNGLRDGVQKIITVKTRGVQFVIPTSLTVGSTISLRYQEYSLGLVPLGNEPAGMFGGGNQRDLTAKVITTGATSTVELTTADTSFSDGTKLNQLRDGSFGAFNGAKAIYFG
jgi:hypothetical protein